MDQLPLIDRVGCRWGKGDDNAPILSAFHLGQMTHSRLQIPQNSSRHVMFVVSLVEEDVFPVPRCTISSKLLERTIFRDAVISTQVFPELSTYLIALERA